LRVRARETDILKCEVAVMSDLRIESYVCERDNEALASMLREDPIQAKTGLAAMNDHPDSVYMARLDKQPVGYLAMNGFHRRTHTALYVMPAFRRKGIGTALLELADGLFNRNEAVECSWGICGEDDRDALQTMYRHGYYRCFGAYTMERRGKPLPASDFAIRSYEDADYPAWHRAYESAFWHMRAATNQLPLSYFPPSEEERRRFAAVRENLFVLPADGEIAAIGHIERRHLYTVAVRRDLQGRGYGRAMASFLVNTIMERGEAVVELGVVQGNPAVGLYEALGFVVTERLASMKRYYRPDSCLSAPPEGYFDLRRYSEQTPKAEQSGGLAPARRR